MHEPPSRKHIRGIHFLTMIVDTVRDAYRSASTHRKVLIVLLVSAAAWFGVHGLHDSLWSYRYWKVDPWALESPVQWPVVGQHARGLDVTAAALAPCLEPDALVTVEAPAHWHGQGFYVFMWLAYSLPEQHIIPIIDPEDRDQADFHLAYFGDGEPPPPPPGMGSPCRVDRAVLYRRLDRS